MSRHEPVLDAHRPGHSFGCLRLCALSGIPHRFTIGSFAKSPSNSKGAARIVRYHQNQIVVPFITAPPFQRDIHVMFAQGPFQKITIDDAFHNRLKSLSVLTFWRISTQPCWVGLTTAADDQSSDDERSSARVLPEVRCGYVLARERSSCFSLKKILGLAGERPTPARRRLVSRFHRDGAAGRRDPDTRGTLLPVRAPAGRTPRRADRRRAPIRAAPPRDPRRCRRRRCID